MTSSMTIVFLVFSLNFLNNVLDKCLKSADMNFMRAILLIIITFTFNSFAVDEVSDFDLMESVRKPASKKVNMKKLFRKKLFKDAYDHIDPEAVKESHIGIKIIFDVLTALDKPEVIKADEFKFLCEPQLYTYPNAVVYSMEVCKLLVELKKKGTVDKAQVDKVVGFIRKNARKKKFLIHALEELPLE